VIAGLRAQTGSMLLRSWGFPIEFIVAAMECEDWMRDKEPSPDYCDLVLVAQLHSYAGTNKADSLPGIDQTPAYAHLDLGELTANKCLKIVDKAQDAVAHAQSLLNI
jgi:HD-like signal output (HDOD) protein